jgi:hypothetical protein
MHIAQVCLSLVLALAVPAQARKDNSTSIKSQCKSIAKLTELTALVADPAKLEEKADGNTTKIEAIKAKAADATNELNAMTANATLMAECAVFQAAADSDDACQKMAKWEKSIAAAANDTKLQSKFEGNTTAIDEFKAKATELGTKLADMQAVSQIPSSIPLRL